MPPLPVRGAAVGASLPPVPGYLVQKIADGEYIDFTLLRPINLRKLPASEPAQAQLTRLLRSELSPVRSFQDWAEAWAVYAGVVHTRNPGSLGDLISYFLLLSSAAREIGGNGWQQYDAAFRKRAADDKTLKWGEALPTLWVTSVLGSSRTPQSSQPSQVCFNWNNRECSFQNCRYYHICSQCRGSHKVKNCNVPVPARSQPFAQDQEVTRKRSRKWLGPSHLVSRPLALNMHTQSSISPINIHNWLTFCLLILHVDSRWSFQGLKCGFDLGLGPGSLHSACRNCSSSYEQPSIIRDYLAVEIRNGTMAGPFSQPPLPDLHINRFGVIPKSTPGKFRLITDLSFPPGHSVNDLIPEEAATVSYTGIPEAIHSILALGRGALLAKFDIQRAYRLLPVLPSQRRALGMRWEGSFFVDMALPFGLRSAPLIFSRFADVLRAILKTAGGGDYLQNYLDDFLVMGPPNSPTCQLQLDACLATCKRLGVPIAAEKTEGPSSCITYLGFLLNTAELTISLPPVKVLKIRTSLRKWRLSPVGSKRELLSLVGQLQHACQVITLGRPFLRRLIDKASSVQELRFKVRLSQWERDDIDFWFHLLAAWNGKTLLPDSPSPPTKAVSLASDAAGGLGFAAIFQNSWFAAPWPSGTGSLCIAVKELVPIVLAAFVWGPSWSRKRLRFACDNIAVVQVLNQRTCKDRHLAFLLRELTLQAIFYSFTFSATHIPGVHNIHADALSRLNFQAFHRAAPDADIVSTPFPMEVLTRLLCPPWMSGGGD